MINPGNTKGVNLTSLVFSNFLRNPLEFFEKKLILEASISDHLMIGSMLVVDPTQSYEDIKYKKMVSLEKYKFTLYLHFRTSLIVLCINCIYSFIYFIHRI